MLHYGEVMKNTQLFHNNADKVYQKQPCWVERREPRAQISANTLPSVQHVFITAEFVYCASHIMWKKLAIWKQKVKTVAGLLQATQGKTVNPIFMMHCEATYYERDL